MTTKACPHMLSGVILYVWCDGPYCLYSLVCYEAYTLSDQTVPRVKMFGNRKKKNLIYFCHLSGPA